MGFAASVLDSAAAKHYEWNDSLQTLEVIVMMNKLHF